MNQRKIIDDLIKFKDEYGSMIITSDYDEFRTKDELIAYLVKRHESDKSKWKDVVSKYHFYDNMFFIDTETQIYTLLLLKINDLFYDNDQVKKPYQDLGALIMKLEKSKKLLLQEVKEIIGTLDASFIKIENLQTLLLERIKMSDIMFMNNDIASLIIEYTGILQLANTKKSFDLKLQYYDIAGVSKQNKQRFVEAMWCKYSTYVQTNGFQRDDFITTFSGNNVMKVYYPVKIPIDSHVWSIADQECIYDQTTFIQLCINKQDFRTFYHEKFKRHEMVDGKIVITTRKNNKNRSSKKENLFQL